MKILKYLLFTYLLAVGTTTVVDQYQHYNIPIEHWYELSILVVLIGLTHLIAYFVRK